MRGKTPSLLPGRELPAAPIGVVGLIPLDDGFLAVEEHQPHRVVAFAHRQQPGESQQEARRRTAVVGADEVEARAVIRVVMAGRPPRGDRTGRGSGQSSSPSRAVRAGFGQ